MIRSFRRTAATAFLSMMAASALFTVLGCQTGPPPPDPGTTVKPAPGKFHSKNNQFPEDQRHDPPAPAQ